MNDQPSPTPPQPAPEATCPACEQSGGQCMGHGLIEHATPAGYLPAPDRHEASRVEHGIKLIYLAEKNAALRVLAELNHRVHTGYDFNSDPDNITRLVGAVLNGSERIHDVWPVNAPEWRCAWPIAQEQPICPEPECIKPAGHAGMHRRKDHVSFEPWTEDDDEPAQEQPAPEPTQGSAREWVAERVFPVYKCEDPERWVLYQSDALKLAAQLAAAQAEAERLRELAHSLILAMETVRLDRTWELDGNTWALQTTEWAEWLMEKATEARAALTPNTTEQ